MDHLVIEGMRPYDGRYEVDLGQGFTTREWGWIKRLAGYHPLTIGEAFRNYDPEFWSVFAVILLRRVGKVDTHDVAGVYERLADEQFDSVIRLEFGPVEPEGDVVDPSGSSSGSTGSSGTGSSPSSGSSDDDPSKHAGMPGWGSSASVPATSVS